MKKKKLKQFNETKKKKIKKKNVKKNMKLKIIKKK